MPARHPYGSGYCRLLPGEANIDTCNQDYPYLSIRVTGFGRLSGSMLIAVFSHIYRAPEYIHAPPRFFFFNRQIEEK